MRVRCVFFVAVLFLSFLYSCHKGLEFNLRPVELKTESAHEPLGIDNPNPRFSWLIEASGPSTAQLAYRIMVASTRQLLEDDMGDIWDSGMVQNPENIFIPYNGIALSSGSQYFWKVKIWDTKDRESDWSQTASWTMGLLNPSDWKAKWIGLDRAIGNDKPEIDKTRLSARYLRKEISVSKEVRKATASVCGLGLFELYVNGAKIGDQVLAPALSEYDKRAYYLTFDLTEHVIKGQNALGVILGNGRFFAPRKTTPMPMTTYSFPKLIFQLKVVYADGTAETFVSDETWQLTANGPVVANNEYDGEEYDATKEFPGWNAAGFDDSNWMPAELVNLGAPKLNAQPLAPIVVKETLKPIEVKEVSPGVYVYDMGQNLVGWARLNVQGARGTTVKMRFSEALKPDGNLYLDNIRGANVTDLYTLRGEGVEVYEPRFTYHGFRFVELTGFPGKPDLSTLEGRVVYDDLELTGSFETSDSTINAIYKNAYWGIRGNYRSIPTDCPQRDERHGWLGDRALGSKGESFIFDVSRLYAKWMQDIEDAQREDGCLPDVAPSYWKVYSDNITWPAAYPIITEMLYDQYGMMAPIKDHYDSFRKWVLYMKTNYLKENILVKDTYGDWCMPPESQELIHSQDPSRKTSGEVLSTTYYYHILSMMQKFAGLLNKPDHGAEYKQLADSIYKAYNDKFFNQELKYYSNNTATANLLSLAYGLVPEVYKHAVSDNIAEKTMTDFNGHISTGLVGAQWIMRTLTKFGREDIAYRLVTNTDYPSWGYMVQNGATTIWELWNGNTADPAMNSRNHVMLLGDLVIWFYEDLAGIKSDPEVPGFRHIIMKPTLAGDLNFVKASFRSVRGMIRSEWTKDETSFDWEITIPSNTSATVYLPAKSRSGITESGERAGLNAGAKFLRVEEGRALFEVNSGTYQFSCPL